MSEEVKITHVVVGFFYAEHEGDNDFVGTYEDCVWFMEQQSTPGLKIITIEEYEKE